VITLDHKRYEVELDKIQESHRKSRTVKERKQLVPAPAPIRPQSASGPHASQRRLPLVYQAPVEEEEEGNIHHEK
jgi:hypothetical protein